MTHTEMGHDRRLAQKRLDRASTLLTEAERAGLEDAYPELGEFVKASLARYTHSSPDAQPCRLPEMEV